MIDLTLYLEKNVTKELINDTLRNNESICLKTTKDPIVSSDVIGMKIASLVDESLTQVIKTEDQELVKIVSWYDNEMGYSTRLAETTKMVASKL